MVVLAFPQKAQLVTGDPEVLGVLAEVRYSNEVLVTKTVVLARIEAVEDVQLSSEASSSILGATVGRG